MIESLLATMGTKLLAKLADELASSLFPKIDDLNHHFDELHEEFARDRLAGLQAGENLLRLGRAKDAIPILTMVKHQEPNSPVARLLLAAALHMDGDGLNATTELAESLRMNPFLMPDLLAESAPTQTSSAPASGPWSIPLHKLPVPDVTHSFFGRTVPKLLTEPYEIARQDARVRRLIAYDPVFGGRIGVIHWTRYIPWVEYGEDDVVSDNFFTEVGPSGLPEDARTIRREGVVELGMATPRFLVLYHRAAAQAFELVHRETNASVKMESSYFRQVFFPSFEYFSTEPAYRTSVGTMVARPGSIYAAMSSLGVQPSASEAALGKSLTLRRDLRNPDYVGGKSDYVDERLSVNPPFTPGTTLSAINVYWRSRLESTLWNTVIPGTTDVLHCRANVGVN